MRTVVTAITSVIFVVTFVGMVVGILLHSGRGGGLSDMFGGAGGAALGSTAAETQPQPDHVHPGPGLELQRDRAGPAALGLRLVAAASEPGLS